MSSINTRPATPCAKPIYRNPSTLTNEFKERFFNKTQKHINITNMCVMKGEIANYRPLTDIQLAQLEYLSETEKIEIIKTYNCMFASIESLIK
jgi:hypothetical protein